MMAGKGGFSCLLDSYYYRGAYAPSDSGNNQEIVGNFTSADPGRDFASKPILISVIASLLARLSRLVREGETASQGR